jgi:hypothetical protein
MALNVALKQLDRRKIQGENQWGKPMNNGDMNAKISMNGDINIY